MKRMKTQSSQQTTLASFFKPLCKQTKFPDSQSSGDSGHHSGDVSPTKSGRSSSDSNYSKQITNSLSPVKLKNLIGSTLTKSPRKKKRNEGSPSKTLSITKWLSPTKTSSTFRKEDNSVIGGRQLKELSLNLNDIIDISDDSFDESNNSSPVVLRRSPRKHPSLPPDMVKIKCKSSSNNVKNLSEKIIQELDETDNASFPLSVKLTSPNSKKRIRNQLDLSPRNNLKKARSDILKTPDKNGHSPLKSKKENSQSNDDLFLNEDLTFLSEAWETLSDDVDLSEGYRCKVIDVSSSSSSDDVILTLQCFLTENTTKCTLRFPWNQLPVKTGDHVSLKAVKCPTSGWQVSDSDGTWFVLHSDVLISCTTVVGSLFCPRRSVLNHLFKEKSTKSQATAMTVGIIVHQLLQQALKKACTQKSEIEQLYTELFKSQNFLKMVFLQGMDLEAIKETTSIYLPRIVEFIHSYVSVNDKRIGSSSNDWPGEITQINDIEENIWAPKLGLKGKIDATVRVKIHSKTKVMPLEIKTGRVSNSADHRGQVILYCMMLNYIGVESADSGLLLYLKECCLKEVGGGDVEKRDLIMLRNELASRIHQAYLSSQEDGLPALPNPIDRKSACINCPQLVPCTASLRMCGDMSHPLSALIPETTAHLTDKHLEYIFKWMRLIFLEINRPKKSNPIWADPVDVREREGSCISGLKIDGKVKIDIDSKVEVTLTRDQPILEGTFELEQYVIVSNDKQVAVASGCVKSVSPMHLTLLVERDLSKLEPPFHVDMSSFSSSTIMSSFLSILLENSSQSDRLRKLIIDKQLPKFAPKLSSKIKSKGEKVFASLNRNQVRAILQVLSADSFIIVKGMPGTGKSKTVTALIEILLLLDKSVLLTSHTHSAVDNILIRLPASLHDRIIRLGPSKRVHDKISHLTEQSLLSAQSDVSLEKLASFYNSKKIVCATCLSAQHPLIVQREFDYCIVDEASQVCQPETLAALSASKKFVLIGDPLQLPPLVINEQAKELGMGESLLESLDRPAVTTTLSVQYRMNQTISSLANAFTYENQLKCADDLIASATIQHSTKLNKNVDDWLIQACSAELSDAVMVIDISTPDQLNQNVSQNEIDIILSIVDSMIQHGIRDEDMGVMSPYRAQVDQMKKQLQEKSSRRVEVSTVDQYQGRDKSIIFYSATRNKPMVAGSNDILGDKNRLTVAITRAKHKLIIVGNVTALISYPTFKSLFSFIDKSKFIRLDDTV